MDPLARTVPTSSWSRNAYSRPPRTPRSHQPRRPSRWRCRHTEPIRTEPIIESTPHPDTDDDHERRIAAGLVAGEQQALADAFARWGGMVHALLTRSAGHDAADDLAQQVFVEAWRSRHAFDPDRGVVPAWLVGIARNVSKRSFRQVREIPTEATTVDESEPAGDEHVADRLLLAQALADLPDPQRRVLELSFWEDCTQQAVAERLGLPLGTVKSHQRRGIDRLRRILEVSHVA